jgi:hypothetical protein
MINAEQQHAGTLAAGDTALELHAAKPYFRGLLWSWSLLLLLLLLLPKTTARCTAAAHLLPDVEACAVKH